MPVFSRVIFCCVGGGAMHMEWEKSAAGALLRTGEPHGTTPLGTGQAGQISMDVVSAADIGGPSSELGLGGKSDELLGRCFRDGKKK